jgi:aspartate aminotransferase
MTGWRIGYAVGNQDVISAATRLQGHSTSGTPTFIQFAAVAGLEDTSFIEPMRKEFEKRRNIVVDGLNAIPGVKCPTPKGAFYVFPDISGIFGKVIEGKEIKSSMDFCEVLLEKGHVAAVPGIAFGMDSNIRISFATSEEEINEGLGRIKKMVTG